MNFRVNTQQRAFTLIELLTVVAIIGTLSALLLPALSRAAAKGRQAACMSNLRQIGFGMTMFADDNKGWLPTTTHSASTNESWVFTLAPYVGKVDRIRICPADPRGPERLAANGTSYVLNEYTSVDEVDPFTGRVTESYRNLDRLPQPTRTMTVFIGAEYLSPSVYFDHTHSRNWSKGWSAVIEDIQPDRHGAGRKMPDASSGVANYLFADGHVEGIKASILKARIEAGENFAKPPR
jgi:prepilin-type N-terminal cleavage/methylation domain-containing protein/prepilin-type processing-associated H-X9-DG protein